MFYHCKGVYSFDSSQHFIRDNVMMWKRFPSYCPFVQSNH